jgi:hypothetical protein
VSLWTWSTRDPLDPSFAGAWLARLARTPQANFTFDPAYLSFRASQGQHAIAVLAEEGSVRGALVLREEAGRLESGWPWRWQAMLEAPEDAEAVGLEPSEASWLYRQALLAAGPRRVSIHLPCAPPKTVPGYRSGATILYRIDHDDEDLMAGMLPSKRRMVRRAIQRGYEVVEADRLDQYRAFASLQRETMARHGQDLPPPPIEDPRPGESWREWELPWMWLLVAERGGDVASGLGDGLRPGGMLEARTGASTDQARRDGAFALLSYAEARIARDRGYRYINLGGDSTFKREAAGRLGRRITMHRWLGGGRASRLGAYAESAWHRARGGVAAFARSMGLRGGNRALVGVSLIELLSEVPAMMGLLSHLEGLVWI